MKTTKLVCVIVTMIAVAVILAAFTTPDSPEVPYPANYRQWTHVKTGVIEQGNPAFAHFGGFHHIYANAIALRGYESCQFNDGAILVFDVLEAEEKNNALTEGRRKIVDVMVKDSVLYAETGGWGFEEFNGDSKTERNVKDLSRSACFSCHSNMREQGFVFSKLRK